MTTTTDNDPTDDTTPPSAWLPAGETPCDFFWTTEMVEEPAK